MSQEVTSRSEFSRSLHSIPVFGIQVIITTLIVGSTSPSSILRAAALPLVAACSISIVLTSDQFMRQAWSSLLSGTSVGFFLQYVELALLSGWSFEARGPSTHYVSGDHQVKKTNCQPEFSINTIWERLRFGFSATFSLRNMNTPFEVKNVPSFSRRNISYVPSRRRFIFKEVSTFVACFLFLDLASLMPNDDGNKEMFSQNYIPLLTRLGSISTQEMLNRSMTTLLCWTSMYCTMQILYSASSALCVGLGFSSVKDWRPLFGSPFDAFTLRGFWGNSWHQILRKIMTQPARFVTHDILHIPKATLVAQYTKILITFGISGLLHVCANRGGGLPLSSSGAFRFFCTQVLGIVIEDGVEAFFRMSCFLGADYPKRIWTRTIGYIWVIVFLVWSTPAWMYPLAAMPSTEGFLPFSVLKSIR